jgi:colanic acid/amylovoran biosynthesis glycosyltransferase
VLRTSDRAVRLAYVINQYPTVSHTFIRREVLALEQLGCEVMRISLRGWDRELVDEKDRLERSRTRYVLSAGATALVLDVARMLIRRPVRAMRALGLAWRMSRGSERPWYVHLAYLAEACRIEPWLRKAGIEHVHAHFGTNPAEVAMLIHVLGGPSWSFTAHGPEEFDKAGLIGLAEKISRSAFVVAVSSYGRSQLYRLIRHEHWSKVSVVHCGLEPGFSNTPDRAPNPERLVCVGRLCEQKGQLLLIDAAAQLAHKNTHFELVLAGDGELRSEIEASIRDYGLVSRVRITGWISTDEVRNEIASARALVLPSFAEGLPVVLMEAMALRRPVIATYVAGIPELVRPGQDGWLVPAGDVIALVDAMQACLEMSADDIICMGKNGHDRALTLHDAEAEARNLQKLFSLSVNDLKDGEIAPHISASS